jgi:hypothetical protein
MSVEMDQVEAAWDALVQRQPRRNRMESIEIARVCHEVNRALCEAYGDSSQKPWDEADQWQRDSAVKGVEYSIANPDAPPSAQHDAWMRDKDADGWCWGPVKDARTKEHPCMVPYEQLPVEQRAKDHLFRAVVRALEHL